MFSYEEKKTRSVLFLFATLEMKRKKTHIAYIDCISEAAPLEKRIEKNETKIRWSLWAPMKKRQRRFIAAF